MWGWGLEVSLSFDLVPDILVYLTPSSPAMSAVAEWDSPPPLLPILQILRQPLLSSFWTLFVCQSPWSLPTTGWQQSRGPGLVSSHLHVTSCYLYSLQCSFSVGQTATHIQSRVLSMRHPVPGVGRCATHSSLFILLKHCQTWICCQLL